MAVDAAILGVAMTAIGTGANAFNTYLPRISEIRRSDPINDPAIVGDVRMGEIAAVTVTIGVGVLASALTDSPVPAMVSAFMAIVQIILYETALRGENIFEPKSYANLIPLSTAYPEGV